MTGPADSLVFVCRGAGCCAAVIAGASAGELLPDGVGLPVDGVDKVLPEAGRLTTGLATNGGCPWARSCCRGLDSGGKAGLGMDG